MDDVLSLSSFSSNSFFSFALQHSYLLLLLAIHFCCPFNRIIKSIMRVSLLLLLIAPLSSAFQAVSPIRSSSALMAASYDDVLDIGYGVSVPKPMGVIFGENPDPYSGLCIDDVSEGLNGAVSGLRVGDQLLAVDGEVVIGKDFDSTMSVLQNAPANVDLVMYRGPVSNLFTILSNKLGDDELLREEEDEESEEVIMDENYESPVKIEVKPKKQLTPGDFFKAMGKVAESLKDDPAEKSEPKKKTGFFGIGGETIQLDGKDATGLK